MQLIGVIGEKKCEGLPLELLDEVSRGYTFSCDLLLI